MKGTTFSDRELETWSSVQTAVLQHGFWANPKRGFSAEVAITALAAEALEMRRILREMIALHPETTQDPLVLRAVDVLGFNLEPSQPLFPEWPGRTSATPGGST